MAKGVHGIAVQLTLRSSVVVTYLDLAFFTVNLADDTITARLDAYVSAPAAAAGKSPLDIMTSDDINTQFTYTLADLDTSMSYADRVLAHIVATEAALGSGTVY